MKIIPKVNWSEAVKNFILGFIVGWIVDQIAEIIYVKATKPEDRRAMFGIAMDDWFVFGVGAVFFLLRPWFGLGWVLGAAVGSTGFGGIRITGFLY